MRWKLLFGICIVLVGCVAPQPESIKPVAAFEVPLLSEQSRIEFLSVLSAVAHSEGLHVDAASKQELEAMAKAIPAAELTINATAWRGSDDTQPEASAMDAHDHLGQAWLTFFKGEKPDLATKFREHAMREIRLRWPGTLSLPITPDGGLPLHSDLIRTSSGYIVNPSAASKYELNAAATIK